jgi:carotenoid cleavage dioxygenase-like enzyme
MTATARDTKLHTAAIDWVSDDPHLSGNFAPVGPEIDAADLPVMAGRIPEELRGAYLRNGSNPLFKPITYTYPFDGDGMIHAVYLDGGKARYRNRFVRTRGLAVERRASRAVYGGVMRPVPVDPALVGEDGQRGTYKNGAFINVIRHGGKVLALCEATTGYEMTLDLETVGEWRAGTEAPIELGAHNRRHPRTGELFALTYAVDRPLVRFHRIDAGGNLVATFPLELAAPTMIHDFVLTERHIVILACPLVFDLAAAMRGQSPLQWKPELGTRIAVLGLDGGPATWLDAEPFFVFHFANGFEEGGRIVLDYVRHARLGLLPGDGGGERVPPRLHRMAIDLAARRIDDVQVAGPMVEFPRADDRREATPTRYVYAPTLTASFGQAPVAGTFNTIAKMNAVTGDVVAHDFGRRLAGEAVFVPRPGSAGEDEGWLALFVYDSATGSSDFVLLDAAHVDQEPVAVVRLPQRVPQGLHGSWLAA